MRNGLSNWLRGGSAVLSVLTVAACGPGVGQFAPVCPVPGLIKPLAELNRYRTASLDVREQVVRARVVDIIGKCKPGDDPGTIVTTAQVVVDATRGPAMQGDAIGLPVFIAVIDSGAVLDKTEFYLPVEFPSNVDTARATSNEIRMELSVSATKSGAAYGIVAGFQLTPEEVAAWKRNNRR